MTKELKMLANKVFTQVALSGTAFASETEWARVPTSFGDKTQARAAAIYIKGASIAGGAGAVVRAYFAKAGDEGDIPGGVQTVPCRLRQPDGTDLTSFNAGASDGNPQIWLEVINEAGSTLFFIPGDTLVITLEESRTGGTLDGEVRVYG